MGRALAAIVAFILFIIFLVVLFTHGHNPKPTPTNPTQPVMALPDYANTNAAVSFTTDGIINGDDLHRSIRITVAQDRRMLDVIRGYSGEVIDSHTFYNTNAAYREFLRALNFNGFTAKIKNPKVSSDESGQCALGFRYIFDLNNEGEDITRLWTSSCSTALGTWGGNLSTIQALFKDQIPGYSTLTGNVNLQATSLQ